MCIAGYSIKFGFKNSSQRRSKLGCMPFQHPVGMLPGSVVLFYLMLRKDLHVVLIRMIYLSGSSNSIANRVLSIVKRVKCSITEKTNTFCYWRTVHNCHLYDHNIICKPRLFEFVYVSMSIRFPMFSH